MAAWRVGQWRFREDGFGLRVVVRHQDQNIDAISKQANRWWLGDDQRFEVIFDTVFFAINGRRIEGLGIMSIGIMSLLADWG